MAGLPACGTGLPSRTGDSRADLVTENHVWGGFPSPLTWIYVTRSQHRTVAADTAGLVLLTASAGG